MSHFVSFICKTTYNWQPALPPTTLGPFETVQAACDAANSFRETACRAGILVEPMIYSDGGK